MFNIKVNFTLALKYSLYFLDIKSCPFFKHLISSKYREYFNANAFISTCKKVNFDVKHPVYGNFLVRYVGRNRVA